MVTQRFMLFLAAACILCLIIGGCAPPTTAVPFITLTVEQITQEQNLVLVNAARLWPQGQEPDGLISLIENRPKGLLGLRDSSLMLQEVAFGALVDMLTAAKEDGHTGYIVLSAYRDWEKQEELYAKEQKQWYKRIFGQASGTAAPGASEHHTGLAVDLGVMLDGKVQSGFGNTPQGKWVNAHCAEFGFIQRYAQGKEAITGIADEPWHYRYVGIQAAQAMTEAGECLEEYIERHNAP